MVIVGPTASGKSNLGIFLARKFGGEIISADSRQVYRGMDIGTGKITRKEQRSVKHYLLDVANPKNPPAGGFTVSDFKKFGEKAVKDILDKNKIPFIVGGTGFYIDALVRNIDVPKIPPNKKLRAELAKQSAEQLFSRLSVLDPRRTRIIDPKNKRRLIRALEIIEAMGKVPALNTKYETLGAKYNTLWLGLKPKNLERKIKSRLETRLKQGMVKEVKSLLARGVSKKRLYDFGLEYRWVSEYLSGKISLTEMKNGLYKAIVKYSKRQMTWFKRNKEIHWLVPSEVEGINPPAGGQKEATKLIEEFI